ncbi:hypothetical protein FS749_010975 [Ceratobasidium sp. UAMH 11750]|nr:hypothetical protein FS749_010975 [Ceratobasidium sp. UAMH 11750]
MQAQQFYDDKIGPIAVTRENAWGFYRILLDCFRHLALGNIIPPELQLDGQMQEDLMEQSELGSGRSDAWGYDQQSGGPVEPIGKIMYEDDEDDANFNPEAYFSGDEDGIGMDDDDF